MENMKQVIQKITATLIIFTMIMVQYAIVGFTAITYAIDLISTNNENVRFKAYFVEQDKETATVEKSIDSKDLKLNIDVAVKNEGYFNGTISLENAGFKIKDETNTNNYIKEIKDNVIYLNQINAEETAHIEVGIEFLDGNEIPLRTLNEETDVKLKGPYISSRSNDEIDSISKVLVNWKIPQNTKAEILSKVLTNKTYSINEQNKKIVQFLVSSKLTNNNYPSKNTKLHISVPEGATNVEVHKRTTKATNGEKEFTQANYKVENNLLEINVDNSETDGKISWIKGVQDVFVITYEFDENKDLSNTNITVNGTITTFDKETTTGTDIALNGEQSQIDLSTEKDGIISVVQEEKENSIYKGLIYSGENRDFTSDTIVYIDYAGATQEFTITENNPNFTYEEKDDEENTNTVSKEANIEYKSIKVNKVQLSAVLGETWSLTIADKVITNETQSEENGDIIIQLNQGTKTVDIRASKPIKNGAFLIESTKTLLKTEYTRDEINRFTNLEDSSSVQYNLHKYTNSFIMNLKETESKADFKCDIQALMTNQEGQELNMTVVLESKDESQDLYKNPTLKIKLPKQIKNVSSAQVRLLNEKGLVLEEGNLFITEENEQRIINIKLTGEQTSYLGEVVQGTTILIKAQVELDKKAESSEEEILLNYTNENATKYTDQGIEKLKLDIIANQNEEQNQNPNQGQDQGQQQSGNQNDGDENNNQTDDNNQATDTDIKIDITAKVGGETINNGDAVRAGEIIVYTAKITNIGNSDKTGLSIEATIPENTTLIEKNPDYPTYDSQREEYIDDKNYLTEKVERKLTKENISLKSGENVTVNYMVRVNADLTEEKNIENEISIRKNNSIIQTSKFLSKIQKGNLQVEYVPVFRKPDDILEVSFNYVDKVYIKNISSEEQKNVEITINKSDTVIINSLNWYIDENNYGSVDLNKSTLSINSIPANKTLEIIIDKTVANYIDNTIINIAEIMASVKDEKGNIYKSNKLVEEIKGVNIKAIGNTENLSRNTSEYVKVGDKIKYTISLENFGSYDADNMYIDDEISKYLKIEKVLLNQEECKYTVENKMIDDKEYNVISIKTKLKKGEKATVEIICEVTDDLLQYEVKDVEVINKAQISNDGTIITKIAETKYTLRNINNSNNTEPGGDTDNDNTNDNEDNDKFSISGIAWLDVNEDGQRTTGEKTLSNVKVSLLNLKDNSIINKGTTNNEGKYYISNLDKGEYYIIFEYDTSKYRLTQYRANGVNQLFNSDVENITMNLNNEFVNVASTNKITIDNNNIEGIDIGLIEIKELKLSLEKTISKITVTNSSGTKTIKYNNPTLAKVEIKSKYLKNSTVVIEYNIKVKNIGETAGYVKDIVDYIPSSLTFNSKLNKEWYKKDNNIYTNSLADTKIEPGETRTLKLVMTKKMTESNTGLVNNKAEILTSYNSTGREGTGNSETTVGSADVIISVSTGMAINYLVITLIISLAFAIIIYLTIMKKIKEYIKY